MLRKIHTTYRENVNTKISDMRTEIKSWQDFPIENTQLSRYYSNCTRAVFFQKYNSIRHALFQDFITASGQELDGADTFDFDKTSLVDRFRIYYYVTDFANNSRHPTLVHDHWVKHKDSQEKQMRSNNLDFVHVTTQILLDGAQRLRCR